jgi:hypothetical protein
MTYKDEDDHEEFRHPSFGMIHVVRHTGLQDSLFGSSIQKHFSTIVIEIKAGVRFHDLSRDWYMGEKMVCQVEMSHAQFAEMITTPNTGSGVPCTIRYTRDGKFVRVENPPPQVVETEKVKINFRKISAGFVKKISKARDETAELLLGKKAPSKEARQRAVNILDCIITELASNEPFRVDQFSEAAEKVVVAAKAEIDGFVTRAIMATGLKELQRFKALPEPVDPEELPEHEEED